MVLGCQDGSVGWDNTYVVICHYYPRYKGYARKTYVYALLTSILGTKDTYVKPTYTPASPILGCEGYVRKTYVHPIRATVLGRRTGMIRVVDTNSLVVT